MIFSVDPPEILSQKRRNHRERPKPNWGKDNRVLYKPTLRGHNSTQRTGITERDPEPRPCIVKSQLNTTIHENRITENFEKHAK